MPKFSPYNYWVSFCHLDHLHDRWVLKSEMLRSFKFRSSTELGHWRYSICNVLVILNWHSPSHIGLTASESKSYGRFSGMWQTWFALCNFHIFSYLFSMCWKNIKVHHCKLISSDCLKVVIKPEVRDTSSCNRECCFLKLSKNQLCFVNFLLGILILDKIEHWRGERPRTWYRAINCTAGGGNGCHAHCFQDHNISFQCNWKAIAYWWDWG